MKVKSSTLNVRSGPGTHFNVIGQLRKGDVVESKEQSAGWHYVQPGGGWVVGTYLNGSEVPVMPSGLSGIVATFGEAGGPQTTAGRCTLPEPLRLGWEDKLITYFACHALLQEQFYTAFHRIHSEGFWGDLKTFDGCFSDRSIRGTTARRSTHAWGIAVDLNAADNPLGAEGSMSKDVVRIFEAEGFAWGGRFSRRDPMHFQYASGY